MDGRTCLVTGSSRGIGRGIAEHLAAEGGDVVVNYRSNEAAATETRDAIVDAGGSAIAVQADVTDPAQVAGMREEVHDALGPVDVLVNNAGITRDDRFVDMTHEEWDRVISVNLDGAFNCTKEFFEDVAEAEEGRLVNISSVVGKQGNFGQANYAAAKSGLFGFTRTLAIELAPHRSTSNCVAPGFTRTEMLEVVDESIQDRIRSNIPLGRFGTVDEVACVVRFLASRESSFVTGEVIDVNGGMDL